MSGLVSLQTPDTCLIKNLSSISPARPSIEEGMLVTLFSFSSPHARSRGSRESLWLRKANSARALGVLHALSWPFFWGKFCSFLRYRPQGPAATTSCVSKLFCEGLPVSPACPCSWPSAPLRLPSHLSLQVVLLGGITLEVLPSDLSPLGPHRAYKSHGGGRMLHLPS